jgi:hypothetical protein
LTVVVKDASRAIIPGASVEIVDDLLNAKRTFKSDQSGAVPPQTLKPGSYTVSISYPGFLDLKKSVVLTSSRNFTLEAELQIANASMGGTLLAEPVLLVTETIPSKQAKKQKRFWRK